MKQQFYAQGKLLLSGEYFVLDGALALAVPTSRGQKMTVENGLARQLHWKSFAVSGDEPWFEGLFDLQHLQMRQASDKSTADRLTGLFRSIDRLAPGFWASKAVKGLNISTFLEFPRAWGLGSSSTLISLLAQWSATDPFALLDASFGGSGYDLACANAAGPIFYQKLNGQPHYVQIPFAPSFSQHLYFVFLEKKQNSREGIQHYRQKIGGQKADLVRQISRLSLQMTTSRSLWEWNAYADEHETLVSNALELLTVKSLYFKDFPGTVKSLGAWGGDFVLAASEMDQQATRSYFAERGYETVVGYDDMIRKNKDLK